MLNLKTTFFTVKTSNEVYCCRIYFVNYIQNVHIINRTLHGSLEDMDFMFSWQEQYLTRSLRSLVRYCFCHSNIKSISSRNRVISYIYFIQAGELVRGCYRGCYKSFLKRKICMLIQTSLLTLSPQHKVLPLCNIIQYFSDKLYVYYI